MHDAKRERRVPEDERERPETAAPGPDAVAQLMAMQQGHGNAAVTRMLAAPGGAAVLAREPTLTPFDPRLPGGFPMGAPQERVTPMGPSHGTPEDQMKVRQYADAPVVEGPEVPVPVAITVPQYAPKPVGWRSSQEGPGGLKAPYDFPGMDGQRPTGPPVMEVAAEQQRRVAWSAYRSEVRRVTDAHNALVAPIGRYEGFKDEPAIAQAGFHLKDFADLAMDRVVPRTSKSKVTVGSLFTPQGAKAPATDVQTQGLGDNMAKAKRSPAVERQRMLIDAAELDVLGQLKQIKESVLLSEQAGHELQSAVGAREGFDAEQQKKQAEEKLKTAKEGAEDIKTWIGRGLKAVALLSGALAPVVIAAEAASAVKDAAEGSGGSGVAGKIKSAAESSAVSTIAGKVVDLVYSSDIAAASKEIAAAEAAMTSARQKEVTQKEAGAKKGFAASLIDIEKQTTELKEKMRLREAALMGFGNSVAGAGGGTQREQDRMRAIVQAVPVVESVIATTDNLQAAIALPTQDEDAGRGMYISEYAGNDDPRMLLATVGLIKGYKARFTGTRDEWQQRLNSLRKAIDTMSEHADD